MQNVAPGEGWGWGGRERDTERLSLNAPERVEGRKGVSPRPLKHNVSMKIRPVSEFDQRMA